MVGGQEAFDRAAGARAECLSEQRLGSLVAEHHLSLRVQHDDGILEAVEDPLHPRPVTLPVRLLGVDPFA